MSFPSFIDTLLRHPLITLSFGALLTGVLVPLITRQWQLRQKRLEVKIALITQMSESVMRFLMAIQFVHVGARSFNQQAFDDAYREWEIGSAVFGTKLQAYLGSDSTLPAEWMRFAEAISIFYAIEGTPHEQRKGLYSRLRSMLGGYVVEAGTDEWMLIREALLRWKAELINLLMASPVRLVA
jgi:hypothetical protein